MARSEKLTLEYIQMDCVDKTTLKRLHRKFGNDGRLFWYELLRLLGRSDNYIIDLSDKWIMEDVLEAELYVGKEKGVEIINALVKWGNIDRETWEDHKHIWCQSLIDRHENLFNKRKNFPVNPFTEVTVEDDKPDGKGDFRAEMTPKKDKSGIKPIDVAESTQSRVEESKGNYHYQGEHEFLEDWKKVRQQFDGKQTNFNKLTTFEAVNFRKLNQLHERAVFRQAIQGLFMQKSMYPTTRLRPLHFLEEGNFDKYLDAYHNKTQLFTSKAGTL